MNTYTPDGAAVRDTSSTPWSCNTWYPMPPPKGVLPDAIQDGQHWVVIPQGHTFILDNGVLTSAPIAFTLSPA